MDIIAPGTAPVGSMLTEQIASTYDFFKTERVTELFNRYGNQYLPMFQWLRAMGREEPVGSDDLIAWEGNWYHETFKVLEAKPFGGAAGGDPGAGNDLYVTLDPSSLNTLNQFYPRKNDIVTIPKNEVQALIYSIDVSTPSAPILRLMPPDDASNIGPIVAGTILSITNGAFGAGTDQPDSVTLGSTKRTFQAQIFKESMGAEGSQLVNQTWYTKPYKGTNIKMWYNPAYMEADYRLGLKIDGAFTFGQLNTNASLVVPAGEPGAGNKIKTTRGMIPWVRGLGKVMPINAATFEIEDLNDVNLYLKTQGINTGTAMWMVGAELSNTVDEVAKEYSGTGTDFTRVVKSYFGGSESLALSVDFQTIRKGGITFLKKTMDIWSHPKTYGAPGYDTPKYGLIAPLTTVKDKKTGKPMMNLATRYRALGNYSRRFEVWDVRGAGNGLKVISIDKTNTYMRSHLMLQVLGLNQWILQDPS